jgi:hypothetical protein
VRGRKNARGKERKSVRKKGRGENEVYLLLRRIIYVVSSYYLIEGTAMKC